MAKTMRVAVAVLAAVVGAALGCVSAFIFAFALELLSRVLGAPIVWALLLFALVVIIFRCGARLLEK